MTGAMGSGKTTMALKISKETGAQFYSLDSIIKGFNEPIKSLKDYEFHMTKALAIISASAIQNLKDGQSVVFDFGGGMGHWEWLKNIADSTGADMEIYHFDNPLEVRMSRVKKRNVEKPKGLYHFTMSDEEIIASKDAKELPLASERVKIFTIKNSHI